MNQQEPIIKPQQNHAQENVVNILWNIPYAECTGILSSLLMNRQNWLRDDKIQLEPAQSRAYFKG